MSFVTLVRPPCNMKVKLTCRSQRNSFLRRLTPYSSWQASKKRSPAITRWATRKYAVIVVGGDGCKVQQRDFDSHDTKRQTQQQLTRQT